MYETSTDLRGRPRFALHERQEVLIRHINTLNTVASKSILVRVLSIYHSLLYPNAMPCFILMRPEMEIHPNY